MFVCICVSVCFNNEARALPAPQHYLLNYKLNITNVQVAPISLAFRRAHSSALWVFFFEVSTSPAVGFTLRGGVSH